MPDLAKFYVNSFEDVKARSDVYLAVDKSRTQKIKQLLPKVKRYVEYLGLAKIKMRARTSL